MCRLAHFPPSMAQPLRGWSAPRGGVRPSGGVLLELGVQRQHRDPSAPLLKGGKQKTFAVPPRLRRCEPRLVNSCYQINCLGRARILEKTTTTRASFH